MLKEPGLSSLTAIFGSSREKSQGDSEKLLDLYWNRAELKKEFAGMRKEQFKLHDQIKQKDGIAARLQQKLDHLEELLVDPDWAHNVIAFYQLRGVALRCQQKLGKFAEQLKQQREQKEHNRLLVAWNEERTNEARVFEQQLGEKRATVQQLEDQLQAERRRLSSMSGFLKIFKRRSVTAAIASLAEQIETSHHEEENLLTSIEEVQNRAPPETEGLDIPTKRSINLMIIAFAQQLLLIFSDDELAAMAKEASEKSVGALNYGTRTDCETLLGRIDNAIEMMEQASDFAEALQHRARLLGEKALFRNDTDVVPVTGSVSTLFDIDSNGLVKESDVDILGENWWGISKILSR
jgi:hypothetical protein